MKTGWTASKGFAFLCWSIKLIQRNASHFIFLYWIIILLRKIASWLRQFGQLICELLRNSNVDWPKANRLKEASPLSLHPKVRSSSHSKNPKGFFECSSSLRHSRRLCDEAKLHQLSYVDGPSVHRSELRSLLFLSLISCEAAVRLFEINLQANLSSIVVI